MKKFATIILFCLTFIKTTQAIVIFDKNFAKNPSPIEVAGFSDFVPVGYYDEKGNYNTVIYPFVAMVNKDANLSVRGYYTQKDFLADYFIGCYANTERFELYKPIYPAILTSPISVITLPQKKITKISELKDLRAGVYKNEPFSDYVTTQIKAYKPIFYDNYAQMLVALFNNQIDYIFTNYYYGIVQVVKEGISNEVFISKQPLWSEPLFICVNEQSKEASRITEFFQKHLNDKNNQQKIKENLIKIINDIKIKYKGVSAPLYVKESKI